MMSTLSALEDTQLITSSIGMPDLLASYLQENADDSDVWLTLEEAEQDLQAFSASHLTHASLQPLPRAATGSRGKETPMKPAKFVPPRPDWKRLERAALSNPERSPVPAKKKKKSSRGKKSSLCFKANRDCKSRDEGFELKRVLRLQQRSLNTSDVFVNHGFDALTDPNYSLSGWQGVPPPKMTRLAILKRYASGQIKHDLKTFLPVPYIVPASQEKEQSAVLLDKARRVFLYRSTKAAFLLCENNRRQLCVGIELLVGESLLDDGLMREYDGASRGPHFACIVGHARQYSQRPKLTEWDRNNRRRVLEFRQLPVVRQLVYVATFSSQRLNLTCCLSNWVSGVVSGVFPGVKARFERSAKWHKETYGIQPEWGLFWNFCINVPFPKSRCNRRVHTGPHADIKNAVAVCAVFTYVLEGAEFNHTQRTWLVIWEAGVVIELPPWVLAVYPSSLLFHFNIDIIDIEFVTSEGIARPTPETCRPLATGDDWGRGSMVFFNQASMYSASETGFGSIQAAKLAGLPGTSDAHLTAQEAFERHVVFQGMDKRF
jgi:hypothetical protein